MVNLTLENLHDVTQKLDLLQKETQLKWYVRVQCTGYVGRELDMVFSWGDYRRSWRVEGNSVEGFSFQVGATEYPVTTFAKAVDMVVAYLYD